MDDKFTILHFLLYLNYVCNMEQPVSLDALLCTDVLSPLVIEIKYHSKAFAH